MENLNYLVDYILTILIFSGDDRLDVKYLLKDLASRVKNCLVAEISKPDDELIFALILKNFSDRQISLDKKLIDYTLDIALNLNKY